MKTTTHNTTFVLAKTLTAALCLAIALLALPAYAVNNELVGSAESHSIEKFDSSGNWIKTFASTAAPGASAFGSRIRDEELFSERRLLAAGGRSLGGSETAGILSRKGVRWGVDSL